MSLPRICTSLTLVVLINVPILVAADIGTAFTYQGELTLVDVPVNGDCGFVFRLWDAPIGGNQIGPNIVQTLTADKGRFSAVLDFETQVFIGQARWLEIEVCSPAPCNNYTLLDPRQELTPAPNALYSDRTRGVEVTAAGDVGIGTDEPSEKLTVNGSVESLSGGFRFPDDTLQTTAAFWNPDGSNIYFNDGSVGIGTETPDEKLSVDGTIQSTSGGFKFPDGSVQTTASGTGGAAVPIGSVIDWWRPDEFFPFPDGYAICDGSVVSDPNSPFNGEELPDLRNRFVRGAATASNIGDIGGTAIHDHSIDHNHPAASTGNSGAHAHQWSAYDAPNRRWTVWGSSGGSFTLMDWGDGMDSAGTGHYPVSTQATNTSLGLWTNQSGNSSGNHQHSIDVAPLSGTSGDAGTLPPYVGLLKIMRIR